MKISLNCLNHVKNEYNKLCATGSYKGPFKCIFYQDKYWNDDTRNLKLYQYHLSHPDNIFLNKINIRTICSAVDLYQCYNAIIYYNQIDIIVDIINDYFQTTKLNDNIFVICIIAIDFNRQDIMDMLISSGFDINSYIINNTDNHSIIDNKLNAMDYCMRFGNLDIFKYLIEKGGDMNAITYFNDVRLDIFDFYLHNVEKCNLEKILHDILFLQHDTNDNQVRLFKLKIFLDYLNHNSDLEKISKCIDDNFGILSVDIISLLEEYDIQFDYGHLLQWACFESNDKLVEYLLIKGVRPSTSTIQHVFDKLKKNIINIFTTYDVDFSNLEQKKNVI